jgi:hypothetical protein
MPHELNLSPDPIIDLSPRDKVMFFCHKIDTFRSQLNIRDIGNELDQGFLRSGFRSLLFELLNNIPEFSLEEQISIKKICQDRDSRVRKYVDILYPGINGMILEHQPQARSQKSKIMINAFYTGVYTEEPFIEILFDSIVGLEVIQMSDRPGINKEGDRKKIKVLIKPRESIVQKSSSSYTVFSFNPDIG